MRDFFSLEEYFGSEEAAEKKRKAQICCLPTEGRWRGWFPGGLTGCGSALGAPQSSCHGEWAPGDADSVGGVDVPSNPPPNAVEVLLLSFSAKMGSQCNSTPRKYIKTNTGLNILGVKKILKILSFLFAAVTETTTNKMKTVI